MFRKQNLDLQFFAENENGSEAAKTETTKTYTQAELDTLIKAEQDKYTKLKSSFDKTSTELSEAKKKINENLSVEEKKKVEDEKLSEQLKSLQDEVLNYKLKEQLIADNTFTVEEASKIIENKNDMVALAKTLNEIYKAKLENSKKQWQADLLNKSTTPSSTGESEASSLGARKAKELSNKKPDEEEDVKWGAF